VDARAKTTAEIADLTPPSNRTLLATYAAGLTTNAFTLMLKVVVPLWALRLDMSPTMIGIAVGAGGTQLAISNGANGDNPPTIQTSVQPPSLSGLDLTGVALADKNTAWVSGVDTSSKNGVIYQCQLSCTTANPPQWSAQDGGTTKILRAIAALAHSLGMNLVAEGIETREQAIVVNELGFEYGQGFLFSKAIPEAQAGELLKREWPWSFERRKSPSAA